MSETLVVAIASAVLALVAAAYALRTSRRASRRENDATTFVSRLSELLDYAKAFALAARRSPNDVRQLIDATLRDAFPAIDAVAFFAQRGQQLVCVYATPGSRLERYAGRAEYPLGDGDLTALPVIALHAGKTITNADANAIHPGCASAIAVPLMLDKGNTSVVYMSSAAGRGFSASLPAIEMLIEQAEPALLLADEREETEARATFDSLTGLPFRVPFEARLREEIAEADRTGSSLALVYLDLDKFKELNDNFGHHAGDLCLQRFAEILNDHRATSRDFAGRRGGDEFCAVFTDVDKGEAIRRATQLSAAIAFDDKSKWVPLEQQHRDIPNVTASIGVALYARDAATMSELFFRADAFQGEAKERGRGRVCFLADDGSIGDIPASESDRRDQASRPYSDRRAGVRDFAAVREVS